jgi:hypothetical protein
MNPDNTETQVIATKETKQGKEIKYEKQKERKDGQVKQDEIQ